MNAGNIAQSKYFRIASLSVGTAIIALVVFVAGVAVGIHKAKFSYAWGENYERNFIGAPRGMMGIGRTGMMGRFDFDGRDFRNAHGIAGKVVSVSDSSLLISDKDNKENTVAVSDTTILKRNGDTIKLSDIAKDDNVVVIGSPSDSGVINADFIRVFQRGTN